MKKNILFFSFALCAFCLSVGIQSCKKTEAVDAANSPKTEEFFDGDEYDRGVVVEEPDEVEEPEEDDYQGDAATKIVSITGYKYSESEYLDAGCTTYKWANYLCGGGNQADTITLSQPDSIISIVTNRPEILAIQPSIEKISSTKWVYIAGGIGQNQTKRYCKITATTGTGKLLSKSIQYIFGDGEGFAYGTSQWSRGYQRRLLGKESEIGTLVNIPSNYVPQQGDVLSYGNENTKQGVITTIPVFKAATRTKPAGYKFKVVEMNARCTNRKTTKSITMTDPTQIISADGVTFATKYFRD